MTGLLLPMKHPISRWNAESCGLKDDYIHSLILFAKCVRHLGNRERKMSLNQSFHWKWNAD